eukprot:802233-Prymnesium_polylepis.2
MTIERFRAVGVQQPPMSCMRYGLPQLYGSRRDTWTRCTARRVKDTAEDPRDCCRCDTEGPAQRRGRQRQGPQQWHRVARGEVQ